ncbi:hypothetical protein C8R45DRAFT_1115215 [Mycena sanguinolenta]|nr:hypothetical protein C8R45DRAFT_1115215 [Mycena sanguinolenta]
MHEKYQEIIALIVAERWVGMMADGSNLQTKKDPDGPFRAKITWEVFRGLPQEEQDQYAARAKAEAAEARQKFDEDLKKTPSKAPRTAKLLIEMRNSVSYGRTRNRAAHFPDWAKERWTLVLDLMKEYLGVAFSKQAQSEASLPEDLLAKAKYTIDLVPDPDHEIEDGESSSDSSSSDLDDSNLDSDDSDAVAQQKKKKKEAGKKTKDGCKAKGAAGNAGDGKAPGKGKKKAGNKTLSVMS